MNIRAKFASTYGFTLAKWVFFDDLLILQNLKVPIYKDYRVSGRSKKTKKNVVIADFSKIEVRLKASLRAIKKKEVNRNREPSDCVKSNKKRLTALGGDILKIGFWKN